MTAEVAPCARSTDFAPSSRCARKRKRKSVAHSRPDVRPKLAPWQVRVATQIMLRDVSEIISVHELASECRLSLCYFIRAFSNTMGIAPYAWFVRQRVQRAEDLLARTQIPIAQIALECGFSDQAHFTKAFAKANGIPPARWRRSCGIAA